MTDIGNFSFDESNLANKISNKNAQDNATANILVNLFYFSNAISRNAYTNNHY